LPSNPEWYLSFQDKLVTTTSWIGTQAYGTLLTVIRFSRSKTKIETSYYQLGGEEKKKKQREQMKNMLRYKLQKIHAACILHVKTKNRIPCGCFSNRTRWHYHLNTSSEPKTSMRSSHQSSTLRIDRTQKQDAFLFLNTSDIRDKTDCEYKISTDKT